MSIRKEFPQRGRNFQYFIRKTIRIRLRIPSQCLIRSLLFEIWCLKFASECLGRVRIGTRIRSRIAAIAVHSDANRWGSEISEASGVHNSRVATGKRIVDLGKRLRGKSNRCWAEASQDQHILQLQRKKPPQSLAAYFLEL